MIRKLVFYIILAISILTSCVSENKEDFYKFKFYESDMLRMPIYNPFDLISSDGTKNWNLNYPDSIKIAGIEDFCIDSVNFINQTIIFHSCDSRTVWGIIDIKSNFFFSFSSYLEYEKFVSKNKLNKDLNLVLSIFNNWIKTGNLPWQKEIPLN